MKIDSLITSNDPRRQRRAIRTIKNRACGFSMETLIFLNTERDVLHKKLLTCIGVSFNEIRRQLENGWKGGAFIAQPASP